MTSRTASTAGTSSSPRRARTPANARPRAPAPAREGFVIGRVPDPVFEPLDGYDGSHRAQVALKRVTSVLTGRFVAAAVIATREAYGDRPPRRYEADLVV